VRKAPAPTVPTFLTHTPIPPTVPNYKTQMIRTSGESDDQQV